MEKINFCIPILKDGNKMNNKIQEDILTNKDLNIYYRISDGSYKKNRLQNATK